jgi:hypothetical protein
LQQWDGVKLIPLSFTGTVDLTKQGTGSGNDPSLFLRSDGAGGWVLAPGPVGPQGPPGEDGTGGGGASGPSGPRYEPVSNGVLPNPELLFDGETGDIMMEFVDA